MSESIIIEVGYGFCMGLYESKLACVIKSGKHVVKHTVIISSVSENDVISNR